MAGLRVSQQSLAVQIQISQGTLSAYLNGYRKPPRDFEARVMEALDLLAAANRAADEARRQVLAS